MSLTCLVLGANGFIGSHIVDGLTEKGFKVKAFDRYSAPPQFSSSETIEIIKGDIYSLKDLEKALIGSDYVFHCFSATTPFTSDNDPLSDIDKNLRPSIQLLEKCVKTKIKKIIFISSGGAIYGKVAEQRPAEEDDTATPVSPYGIIKLAIEGFLAYFNKKSGLDYVVYRLSNPYGPRQSFRHNQGVIPAFLEQIEENNRITVLGDGSATRDYIYINDAIEMIVNSFSQKNRYFIYNIGRGQQISINEIISALKEIVPNKFKIEYIEAPKTFLQKAELSIDRFSDEFGQPAFNSLEKGLKETITYAEKK